MKSILFLIIVMFFSCKNSEKEQLNYLIREWSGKEIIYPTNLIFTTLGKDTIYSPESEYIIVSYVDSIGCVGCKMQLLQWERLINQLDTLGNTSVLFFLYPKDRKELIYILKRDNFAHPVYIDETDSFNKLNKLPLNVMFQTFLLDKKNKVVGIGNPVHNLKVKELYLKIIMGDKAPKEEMKNKTTVNSNIVVLDLGEFDWEQERIEHFELTNTGNSPLVIIDVATSCGCTSTEYNREPVQPGESVELKVRYKADHPEFFNKTITVHYNAEASPMKLSIKGNAQ